MVLGATWWDIGRFQGYSIVCHKWKWWCHDPSLGFVTKAMAWKGVNKECNLIVKFTLPEVLESVRQWSHTFPSGFPLWELESLRTPKSSKSNLRSQNSLDWKLIYTIGKILRLKNLKWGRIIHSSTYNTSYDWKKGQESKCQFDSWPLKVRNHLNLHMFRRHVRYHCKVLNKEFSFVLGLTSIGSLHKKLWASKMAGILISGIPTWSPWKNTIWV